MMTFWLIVAAMLGVALAALLPPLLGGARRGSVNRRDLNLAIYQERLAELEQERADGGMDEEQLAKSRSELDREMLHDVDEVAEETRSSPAAGRLSAVLVAIAVPALAIGLYLKYGDRQALEVMPAAATTSADSGLPPGHPAVAGQGPTSVQDMVKALAARMQSDPNNVQGWVMLGRSYTVLKRFSEARDAYAKAYALNKDNAEVLAGYAESIALTQSGRLTGEPKQLLDRALKLQPDNPNALWLEGMAAFQSQSFADAVKHWQQLSRLVSRQEDKQLVDRYLAQAQAHLGGGGLPMPAAEETAAAAAPSPARKIEVHVALAPDLGKQASPGDTVFIFARAAQGPRMPLAIVRKTVSDLPADVTLDDSMAMTPAMKLSNFPSVVVGARISKSGNAMPQSGDLEGISQPLGADVKAPVEITINRQI